MELTTRNTYQIANGTINREVFKSWTQFIEGSDKTVQTYTRAIRQFVIWTEENDIYRPTKEDIKAYKDYLLTDHKPATVQLYLTAVKRFYEWAEEEGLTKNVAKNVKSVKLSKEHKKDALTASQAKTLTGSLDRETLTGKRDYAILTLMITTGMRTHEVANANIEDLRNAGDFTVLYFKGKGRTEKAEFKKIAEPVEKAIREYLTARGKADPKEALFASVAHRNNGQRMTTRSISRIVKDHMIEAGLESDRLTAHSLRHTCATQNLLNGGSLEETQLLLGHKDINTTMIYNHAISRANSKAEERIANVLFN